MATFTTNYNLKKPDVTDFVDIQDLNDNADAIDEAMNEHVTSTNNPHRVTAEQTGAAVNKTGENITIPGRSTDTLKSAGFYKTGSTYSTGTVLDNHGYLRIPIDSIREAQLAVFENVGGGNSLIGMSVRSASILNAGPWKKILTEDDVTAAEIGNFSLTQSWDKSKKASGLYLRQGRLVTLTGYINTMGFVIDDTMSTWNRAFTGIPFAPITESDYIRVVATDGNGQSLICLLTNDRISPRMVIDKDGKITTFSQATTGGAPLSAPGNSMGFTVSYIIKE